MHSKFEMLRQFLSPVTDEQARVSTKEYEASQVDAPGFAYAAEIDMRPEYQAAAHTPRSNESASAWRIVALRRLPSLM